MDEKNGALSPTEVLEGALLKIESLYQCKRVDLDDTACCLIANDGDRESDMRYKNFILLTGIGKKSWGIAVGEKDESYPGNDLYCSDIIAVAVEKELDENSQKILFSSQVERGEYFRNSFLIALTSGYLRASKKSVFGTKATEWLDLEVRNDAVANRDVMTLGMNAFYDKAATYRPEAIDLVVENIISILSRR